MNVEDVLAELGIETDNDHHHATSNFEQVDCPFCSPGTRNFRMGVGKNGRSSVCWTCGVHPVGESLSMLSGRPLREIYALLGRIPRTYAPADRPRGKLVLPNGVGPMQDCHRAYLRRRKIDPDRAEKLFGVQGIGFAVKMGWRLFLPVSLDGQTVSWTTRSVRTGGDFKYVSAKPDQEAFPHKHLLYGEDLVRGTVIVHEGPMDVLRTGPGAVCLFGVGYSPSQVKRLAKYPTRIVCLDSDSAGRKAADKLCGELGCFPGRTVKVELSAHDAADADDSEIALLRKLLR